MNSTVKSILIAILVTNSALFQAQKNDSTRYFNYYLTGSIISRLGHFFDIGIERIGPIKKNCTYSSLLTVACNNEFLALKKPTIWSPRYYGISFQPFHLLVGKNLKFETGFSGAIQIFDVNNQHYPLDTSRNAYNSAYVNRLKIFYSLGLRYTFKQNFSVKIVSGPRYWVDLGNHKQYFNYFGFMEIGANYRFRIKKRYGQSRHL